MISRSQAQSLLLEQPVPELAEQQTPLSSAHNLVLARDLASRIDLPPFSTSAMDGYAYRWRPGWQSLRVAMRVAAGQVAEQDLGADDCARVFTGAMLPIGADSVIPQEDCQLEADQRLSFTAPTRAGIHTRPAASEFQRGNRIISSGTRIGAEHIALAAACGWDSLPTFPPLRVAVISSGDELVPAGSELVPGQIYNSNAPMLASWLERAGCAVQVLAILGDSLDATTELLRDCAANYQAVILSGGVSVGEEDHVRAALEQLGEILVYKVAIKPGKPFTCARIGSCYLFGLPGNPVSALVTLEILARPLLLKLAGQRSGLTPQEFIVQSACAISPEKRERYLRAELDAEHRAHPHPRQLSSSIVGLSQSLGYLRVEAGATVRAGDSLSFIPYSQLRY